MRVIDFAPPPTSLPDLSLAEGRQLSKLSVQQATGSLPGASVFQAVRDSQREGMAIGPALRAGDYKEAAAAFIRSTAAALGAIPEVHNLAGFAGIISAYHGSPHLFDEFKLEKVGTGEGAQAYGHGLYFAEKQGVAESYQKGLSVGRIAGGKADWNDPAHVAAAWTGIHGGDQAKALSYLEGLPEAAQTDTTRKAAEMLRRGDSLPETGGGALYHVDLDVKPEDLLDWDKPLSEQSPGVREKLASIGVGKSEWRTGENGVPELHADGRQVAAIMRNWEGRYTVAHEGGTVSRPTLAEAKDYAERSLVGDPTGEGVYRDAAAKADPASASAALRAAGIPGIRYLDAGSRKTGDGTRNVVMFDPSRIKIEAVNGQPVTSPAAKAADAMSVLAHPEAWGAK